MKILKKVVLASVFAASLFTIANADDIKTENPSKYPDYYGNYYDEGGALLFKIRGFYANTGAKTEGLPPPVNIGTSKAGRLVQHGLGGDGSATIFLTDSIATEISIGLIYFKTKRKALSDIRSAYGTATGDINKKHQIYFIPTTITAQYHIAPYGGIRPYFGAGYTGTYMHTRSKAFKIKNDHGPVMQVGVDFISKDDTLFTFDVRKYFLKSKLTFRNEFLGTDSNDISSKVSWNPLVVSLGFGFKF